MKISYNWLKDYISFDISPSKLSEILTNLGLEVEALEEWTSVKGGLKGIVTGKVLTCEKHPRADRLWVTRVDVGGEAPLDIVCGAPNVTAGQIVPVALAGATVYKGEQELEIRKAKIRGAVSEGMICAEDELGLGESHEGIMVLKPGTPVGLPASEYFEVETDYIIEIGLTPNRIDGGSHYGVARDLAAFLSLQEPEITAQLPDISGFSIDHEERTITVEIENARDCNRYAGLTISGVKVQESPGWLKQRLQAIGLSPVNNVVDATNYVLHECGQPLHAFDADRIRGNRVLVKNLPEGTPFITLDEEKRTLSEKDLMICNAEEGMCIAGVFGGIGSGVTETSRNIFLESAYFHPVSVRRTARRHGLNTDASFHFERGVDPEMIPWALKRAALLIRILAGGKISSPVVDQYPAPVPNHVVEVQLDHVLRLTGKKIDTGILKRILKKLDINILEETDNSFLLEVPAYRVDVTREADVIEEILRVYGYNTIEIPDKLSSTLSYRPKPDREQIHHFAAEALTSNGFREIMNNSLNPEAWYKEHPAYQKDSLVYIQNPLSNDLNVMRQSLLPGGLNTIKYNLNRQEPHLRFYEFGHTYRKAEQRDGQQLLPGYREDNMLALFMTGSKGEEHWRSCQKEEEVYDLRTYLELVLVRCGIPHSLLELEEKQSELLSQCLTYKTGKFLLAQAGPVSGRDLKAFGIPQPVMYAEIYLEPLRRLIGEQKTAFTGLPRFPSVRRDLALLLHQDVLFEDLKKVAFNTEKKLLRSVDLFDVYESEKLGRNKKSYALSFVLRDDSKTLTDKQVDKVMNRLIRAYENKFDAQLR